MRGDERHLARKADVAGAGRRQEVAARAYGVLHARAIADAAGTLDHREAQERPRLRKLLLARDAHALHIEVGTGHELGHAVSGAVTLPLAGGACL